MADDGGQSEKPDGARHCCPLRWAHGFVRLFDRVGFLGLDRALAVDRSAQGVDDAAEQTLADGRFSLRETEAKARRWHRVAMAEGRLSRVPRGQAREHT